MVQGLCSDEGLSEGVEERSLTSHALTVTKVALEADAPAPGTCLVGALADRKFGDGRVAAERRRDKIDALNVAFGVAVKDMLVGEAGSSVEGRARHGADEAAADAHRVGPGVVHVQTGSNSPSAVRSSLPTTSTALLMSRRAPVATSTSTGAPTSASVPISDLSFEWDLRRVSFSS